METPVTPASPPADPAREIRWFAEALEQAQRQRAQTGERICAAAGETADSALLQRIRDGETDGPVVALGRAYRRHWEQEREMTRFLEEALPAHPAWAWLGRVRGATPALAAKLLARLDVGRADTPSGFWSYCGLATVPGREYRCQACGLKASYPVDFQVPERHARRGGEESCRGEMRPVAGQGDGVRVAQPRPGRGERPAYDAEAKKLCFLLGSSLLRANGAYQKYYERERAKLDGTRPQWAPGRRHLTALRKMEKLFLSHLWLVWREAAGLPVTEPYEQPGQAQDPATDPWSMVVDARRTLAPRARTGPHGELLPPRRLPLPEKPRSFRHSRP